MIEASVPGQGRFSNVPIEALRWLAEAARRLGAVSSLGDLVHQCETLLEHFSNFEYNGLYLRDLESGALRLFYAHGFTDAERVAAEASAWDRHPGWVMRNRSTLSIADTHAQSSDSPSKESPRRFEVRSRLWIPVMMGEEVFGAFGFASTRPHSFDDFDQEVLVFVAELAAASYQQLQANRAAEVARIEQARAMALERASDARFRSLFLNAPQPMLMVDADGKVTQSNRGAQALFGYAEAELQGRFLQGLVPSVSPALASPPHQNDPLSAPHAEPERIVTAFRSGGEPFSAEIGLVPLDVDGTTQVLVGLADVSERVQAQQHLQNSLREKETLLREIHHRVKNNLQIISSLLMLQRDTMPASDAAGALVESVHRVQTMALIHQQLYGVDNLERIELADYVPALISMLQGTFSRDIGVRVQTDPVEVTIEVAVPVGLILNELLTNAFKYGRPPPDRGAPPEVAVTLRHGPDGHAEVTVRDNGPGLPDTFTLSRATSLGMELVRTLTRQIRGQLSFGNDDGAVVRLRWKLGPEDHRHAR